MADLFPVYICATQETPHPDMAKAIRDDLHDVLTATECDARPFKQQDFDSLGASGAPLLVLSQGLLNPMPSLVDSLIDALEEVDAVLGCSMDGRLYCVACTPDVMQHAEASETIRDALHAMSSGSEFQLAKLAEALTASGLSLYVAPAWWTWPSNASPDQPGLRALSNMLDALACCDDMEFLADRTRIALQKYIQST